MCKPDLSNRREFKKILKGKSILEKEGKSKTRSNGKNFISCRSRQSNLWFSVTGNFQMEKQWLILSIVIYEIASHS